MTVQLSPSEMEQIAARYETISDKARALTDAGCSIGQIGRVLNRSYQQIRQIVKSYEARKARESQPSALRDLNNESKQDVSVSIAASALFRLSVSEDGSLILPRHVLEAANIKSSQVVIGVIEAGQIILSSAQASMDRAQELVRALLPGDDSLAEALLADRRHEVEQERVNG
jgi:bifunctional DNA-binding transcriptional regulator/antitoxin component of YhaV-PrlF toxin-antitoxin module